MNGPLAQIVALTCYANSFLTGQNATPFFPGNSTSAFCESVRFATGTKLPTAAVQEVEVAKTPDEWFTYLKDRRASGVRLSRVAQNDPRFPDRMSAGLFGGGGTWFLEVCLLDNRSEFWVARWEVGNQQAPDRRIWKVTYARVAEGPSQAPTAVDPKAIRSELENSLIAIRAFSAKHGKDGFTRIFDKALETIASNGKDRTAYHKDLTPPKVLPEEALTLLDTCQTAWVFGGMGSWNDLLFQGNDRQDYNRVSDRLFEAINQAIEGATSMSFHPRGSPISPENR